MSGLYIVYKYFNYQGREDYLILKHQFTNRYYKLPCREMIAISKSKGRDYEKLADCAAQLLFLSRKKKEN